MARLGSKTDKDSVKVLQSNPFDALFDGDSGDDALIKAAEQLKQTSVTPKSEKTKKGKASTNGKETVNNTIVNANNVNSRGGHSNSSQYQNGANGQRGNVNNVNARGGYSRYQNGANGQRVGYSNYSRYQNGANGQRGASLSGAGQSSDSNGFNNRNQKTLYRTQSSSRSSTGTDDGASDKAEKSSVKSERELREEEFQKKLKEFIFDPVKENETRQFIAKFPDILSGKSDAEEQKLLSQRAEAWDYIRLSDSKKMTLAEYEKLKEEQKKALGGSKAEKRVVKSSDFDGLLVVAKKNLEEDDSLSVAPVQKQNMEADKTEKSQKIKKKKKVPLLVLGGTSQQGNFVPEPQDQPRGRGRYQGRGRYFSQQQDQPHGRGGFQSQQGQDSQRQGPSFGRGAGPRRQDQSVKQNGVVAASAPVSLDSQDNFPGLRSAPGA